MREKPMTTSGYRWSENTFWKDITARIAEQSKVFSGAPMEFDEGRGAWTQAWSHEGASLAGLLQSPFAVVDVTDRGIGVYPLLLDGRFFVRVAFRIGVGELSWSTHPPDKRLDSDVVPHRATVYEPGRCSLVGRLATGESFELRCWMPRSLPFVVADLVVGGCEGRRLTITPELTWMPGANPPDLSGDAGWLAPRSVPLADEVVAKNNSHVPDPPRPSGITMAGLGVAVTRSGSVAARGWVRARLRGDAPLAIADRTFDAAEGEALTCAPVHVSGGDASPAVSLVLGVCANRADFQRALGSWTSAPAQMREEEAYWDAVSSRLTISCPDAAIERQARYSVHNSLSSRSVTDGGRCIFVHGRRDKGYGDTAILHQSYQMHFPALAAGEGASVREELLAYAARQDARGDVAKSLRPGPGFHEYVGLYSNAHFLMALHRYLSWTGDFGLLDEPVHRLESGSVLDVRTHAEMAADWLLANRRQGVVAPCGWSDAWPPDVKAQAQVTVAACIGIRRLSEICSARGRAAEAERYGEATRALERGLLEVFYDADSGLFGEHLFASGTVEGGRPGDFFAHTQVWAAWAGVAPDTRGLDLARRHCLQAGMVTLTPSSFEQSYIVDSTDGTESLGVDSTATWLLATWPELTHLYALAELRHGRPDEALDAVVHQLPERIAARNPLVAPYYYAEKYLHPDIPWLCTWGGDPTLLEVLLEGFSGVHAELEGLRIAPRIPSPWRERGPLRARFWWRGAQWELTVRGRGSRVGNLIVDGRHVVGDLIAADSLGSAAVHTIDATLVEEIDRSAAAVAATSEKVGT